MSDPIHFNELWRHVVSARPLGDAHSVHGPDHWRRVERNGCVLAARTGANITVVRLFALFHDCRRKNDGWDPEHGRRGADFAADLRGELFDLADTEFELLRAACIDHTDGHHHADVTIGTCWDSDRLDLGRVGMIPDPQYMSTSFGAEIAGHGSIRPWIHLAEEFLDSPETHHHYPRPVETPDRQQQ